MESRIFEYRRCGIRKHAHALVSLFPPLGSLAGATWPAARRANQVELSEGGILARSLCGQACIPWDEVTVVRRHRTTMGRVSLMVEADCPARRIEIVESLPGFDELARTVRKLAGVAELIDLDDVRQHAA